MDLCTPDGRLDPRAKGWSPEDRLRANLRGHFLRKKRWNYWCVVGEDAVFAITLADVDYLGFAVVSVLDLARNEWTEIARPCFPRLPERVREDIAIARGDLVIVLRERGDETTLEVDHPRVSASLSVDRRSESLNVVVPWSADRFQLTSKSAALPARGTVRTTRRYDFDGAFACLDYGRGVWPHRTHWQWAVGAGVVDGKRIGFNLGGTWTRGTGATENALFVDGEVRHLEDELEVEFDAHGVPRRLQSPRVDLSFETQLSRAPGVDLRLLSAKLHWGFGRFEGTIDGLEIHGLRGFAEDMRARW